MPDRGLKLVQIVPIPSEQVTVEQYLQAECCRLVQQLKVRSCSSLSAVFIAFVSMSQRAGNLTHMCLAQGAAELHASQLRKQWSLEIDNLVSS